MTSLLTPPSRRPVVAPVAAVAALVLGLMMPPTLAQWPQWGGPDRDFTIETAGLADQWPEDGPPRLWHRELGVGYSAIVYDDGLLYTMYRTNIDDPHERVVAFDARSGRQVWEHVNAAPLDATPDRRWGGQGPNSTPLVVEDRLYTVGSRAVLTCLDKKGGEVRWRHDLVGEFGGRLGDETGYCCSPIAYKDTVIVAVDRERPRASEQNQRRREVPRVETVGHMDGQTLMAFDQVSGDVVWKGLDFEPEFSSPILIQFDGQDQLVFATREGLIGVDPSNGDLLWHHPLGSTSLTPVWNGEDLVFYGAGGEQIVGVVVRLTKRDGRTVPEQVWQQRKVSFMLPTPVRVGDLLVGSTDRFLLGVDIRSGKRLWAKRGFRNAACLYADGKVIVLDEYGHLGLTTVTQKGMTVLSECDVTERYSLSAPTLVGTTLYMRDRKHIMALDLGRQPPDEGNARAASRTITRRPLAR